MGKPLKQFVDYIESGVDGTNTLEEYAQTPAETFLIQAVHLSDAINHCIRHFPKKADGSYTKNSEDSIHLLSAAALAGLMGHFETFERFLFSGLLEASRLLVKFDISKCCQSLQKDANLSIDIARVASYRGQPAPIGQLIADNLQGWHDPAKVNVYLRSVVSDIAFYSNEEIEQLRVLWQLRHSIVHTGGWLTQPDSQKLPQLQSFGNSPIVLGIQFVSSVVRRLHLIVQRATESLGANFKTKMPTDLTAEENDEIINLFKVDSPRRAWLK